MALMLGQLYDAVGAGNVRDDKARAAAEEVANYEGELSKLRLEMSERFRHVESEQRVHRWTIGFLIALVLAVFALQSQILLRLPS
jgi:hypothetical protein